MIPIQLTDEERIRPEHADRFRCIGPACEDSCCSGWSVFFDRAAVERYERLPEGPLRALVDAHVARLPPKEDSGRDADGAGLDGAGLDGAGLDGTGPDETGPAQFARVQLTAEQACPFLTTEKLCRIQVEHGEGFLSETCATYPRIRHRIGGVEEMALTLSCPEAARLVLLGPELLVRREGVQIGSPSAGEEPPAQLLAHFWPIRALVLRLVTHRAYPLWQRVFLLGVLARRMQALARGELACGERDRSTPAVLRDFWAAVESGALRASMDAIPADVPAQLDAVLRLAGIQLPRSHIGRRFLDTLEAFTRGIGNRPGATMESLIAGYAEAHDRWFEPFFGANPWMLENLLAHTVFRTMFPFGSKSDARGRPNPAPEMEREFALLAGQFALIRGLLIGVAGFHGQDFGAEHVVRTVQSTAKHFEHHPGFLDAVHGVLTEGKPLNIRGLAMLLRP